MGWGAMKSKVHEHALYAEHSKTTSTCNGVHNAPMRLLLTKGPEVMPDTVTQRQKMPQCYRPAGRPC